MQNGVLPRKMPGNCWAKWLAFGRHLVSKMVGIWRAFGLQKIAGVPLSACQSN
jgi:hypothetical protein